MKTIFFLLAVTFLHQKLVFGGGGIGETSTSIDPDYVMIDIEQSNDEYDTVKLFKTYILDLMQAVVTQYKKNTSFLQKGVECAGSVKNDKSLPPLALILSSMTIASDQPPTLDIIRQSNNSNATLSALPDATADDIRKIIDVVLSASTLDLQLQSVNEDSVEKYVEKNDEERLFELRYTNFFENSDQARKCYQLMVGIEHNARFFQLYLDGFEIIRRKMNEDGIVIAGPSDNSQSNKTLDQIIEHIAEFELEEPPQWERTKKEMNSLSFFVSASLYFLFGML